MHIKINILILLSLGRIAAADSLPEARSLFTFRNADAALQWQTVNDGVMGGRSDGRFQINNDRNLEFFGTLSLANNGGFASVRSRETSLRLASGDSIIMKVRGDGREYTLNLYTAARRTAFSYRVTFPTKTGEWTEVNVPLSKFVATSFGRVVANERLKPEQVTGIGILLGDKKSGAFKLEIESIAVRSAPQ